MFIHHSFGVFLSSFLFDFQLQSHWKLSHPIATHLYQERFFRRTIQLFLLLICVTDEFVRHKNHNEYRLISAVTTRDVHCDQRFSKYLFEIIRLLIKKKSSNRFHLKLQKKANYLF